jgi:hypothetical protein
MMKSNANGEAVNTKVRGAAALKFTGPGLTDESAVNAALGESATNTSLHMTEQMDSKLHVDDTEYNLLGSRTGTDCSDFVVKHKTNDYCDAFFQLYFHHLQQSFLCNFVITWDFIILIFETHLVAQTRQRVFYGEFSFTFCLLWFD